MNELEVNEADWQKQHFGTVDRSTAAGILAVAAVPTWAESAEARRERDALAAAATRRENLARLNAAAGNPLAARSQALMDTGSARARVLDLEAQLEQARRDLSRSQGNLEHWENAVAEITAAAAPPLSDDPMAVAGRQAHAAFVEATRAALTAMQTGTPRQARRPFGGEARRSEYCVHCIDQGVSDEDSYLLHSDPELAVPVTSAEQAATAERRGHDGYAEIRAEIRR